jgi:glycosyltransferase involved in cell wall biosynthesis
MVFHAMSPFEEAPLEQVWPRAVRHRDAALVVTAFDLIPLVFAEHYLRDPFTHREYINRCNLLRAADVVLAISEATAEDVVRLLGVPESRVLVIGGGVDPWFSEAGDSPAEVVERIAASIPGLASGFLMYTGGIDYRKNVNGMIAAYALLDADLRHEYQLVVTCSVTDREHEALVRLATDLAVADRVIITGHVSDELLRDLYRACSLFVFPSVYEGFGLPIAEARACGAPVIAGDNSSLRELVPDPRARFDASDPGSIAERIDAALRDGLFAEQLREQARNQDLTWDSVAERALEGYERAASVVSARPPRAYRPRLALVTPWPPQLSGIADYAHMLVEHLCASYDIDIVVDGDPASFARPSARGVGLTPLAGFDITSGWRRYDRIIYQIGNSEYHARAVDMLRRVPGEVIAHDVRLNGLYWWRGHHTSGPPIADELNRMYGDRLPTELHDAPHVTGDDAQRLGIWMLRDVIQYATRIWVHSEYARGVVQVEAQAFGIACDVRVLPFGYPALGHVGPAQLPATTAASKGTRCEGLPAPGPGEPRIVALGILGPSKANDLLVDATPAIIDAFPSAQIVFAGPVENAWGQELVRRATALGVARHVGFTGALSPTDYEECVRRAHIAVQLRRMTNGEASLTVADALANGVPTVVTRLGWFAELPNSVVEGVPASAESADVADAVVRVLKDPIRRAQMIQSGYEHAARNGFDRAAAVLEGC